MKPANLLISVDGAVKVADFGQAKGDFVDREAVSIEMVLGSRGYMAPERVGGHDGQAGDTYALGLSLFELLTGRKVVVSLREDKHDPGVAKHQGWLEPPELQGEWRARLRELFGAMCAYDPSQRPSPGKVARELEWIAAGAGLQADLHAFAAEHVRPLLEPPGASRHREHPRYPDIAFLEREIGQMVEVDNRAAEAHDARDRCEALLSDRDWPNRVPELRRLMNDSGLWAPDALLAVLDDATRPWWRPFGRRVPAHEVLAALELLHTHPDDAVRARAARLATHDDPRVASLAREIAGESAAG